MKIEVECYSGYKLNERPKSFILGGRKFSIIEILDCWYGFDHIYFKVRADENNIYILRYDERADVWTLELFRNMKGITRLDP
jgi:hypothetical protein